MKTKHILLLAVAVVALGGGYGWFQYNRTAPSANDMPVKETVTATDLLAAFNADEAGATARYVGATEQVIEVSGTIRSVDLAGDSLTNVVLETGNDLSGVVCEFTGETTARTWKPGDAATIRGICTGMLMDVLLVRCAAVE